MSLSLKQIQDKGLSVFFSEKEINKQLQQKLEEQQQLLAKPVKKPVAVTLDDVLASGGKYEYRFEGKKYKLSVITPEVMQALDNIDNFNEAGFNYDRPAIYKYHVTTALGNLLYVQAKTHALAQRIIDAIFGKGYYRISSS